MMRIIPTNLNHYLDLEHHDVCTFLKYAWENKSQTISRTKGTDGNFTYRNNQNVIEKEQNPESS